MDYGHARIFSTYGPGDHPWSLISSCIRTFREDGLMEMTPCTQMWNFMSADDCAASDYNRMRRRELKWLNSMTF